MIQSGGKLKWITAVTYHGNGSSVRCELGLPPKTVVPGGIFHHRDRRKVYLNKEHQFGVDNLDLNNEISQDQRGTALTTASLLFAGSAIILSENPGQYISQIEVFAAAFGLIPIAAFTHALTLKYRIVLTFQEMALEYGLLFIAYGLFLLISKIVADAATVMMVVFVVVLTFRLVSVKKNLKHTTMNN